MKTVISVFIATLTIICIVSTRHIQTLQRTIQKVVVEYNHVADIADEQYRLPFYHIEYKCELNRNINDLHPTMRNFVHEVITTGQWYVFETKRGLCRQVQMMQNSVSPRFDSKHLVGTAVDIVCFNKHGSVSWDCDWNRLVQISEQYDLLWGGAFPSHYDPAHFEMKPMSPL